MTESALSDCELLVVGSGAGGAPTAAVLAEAGFDVLVVEEGPWVPQGSVTPFSLEQMDLQYRSGGVTVALGRPSIAYTEGCCVGGGTEVNSGLYRRPPADTVDRWRRSHQVAELDPDDLHAIAREVEAQLSVGPLPGPATAASEALRRGAAQLGWEHDEIPRWMTYPPGGDATSGWRQSMTETFLPRAQRAGARVVPGCRVVRIHHRGGEATHAEVERLDPAGAPVRSTVRFRHVFVCGGAIQTPALLQRSGLRHRVGRTLAVHPTVKLAARFPDPVNTPHDVPVHQVTEFAPALSFGGSASSTGLVALALSDNWAHLADRVEQWRHLSVYYAAITSEGRGTVQALPGLRDPVVTYWLTRRDRELLGSGLARLALLLLEAGAEEVYPCVRGVPVVRSRADLAELTTSFSASRASVMTVHLCSTVPMGEDRRRCATDSFGRVHGMRNVYVNDASLLPDAPGVNPQGSVMAVAVRNARHFVASERPRG